MNEIEHGDLKSYTLGFVLSLILTLSAYFIVTNHWFSHWIGIVLLALGILQAAVQLVLFLHLGQESKPHWNMTVFLFMVMVVAIVVIGSIWIMNNLNYNVMPKM